MCAPSIEYARAILAEERRRGGERCERCRANPGDEFHHLKPTGLNGRGRGMTRRAYDIRRHRRSYILLCIACHRKEHYGAGTDESERDRKWE